MGLCAASGGEDVRSGVQFGETDGVAATRDSLSDQVSQDFAVSLSTFRHPSNGFPSSLFRSLYFHPFTSKSRWIMTFKLRKMSDKALRSRQDEFLQRREGYVLVEDSWVILDSKLANRKDEEKDKDCTDNENSDDDDGGNENTDAAPSIRAAKASKSECFPNSRLPSQTPPPSPPSPPTTISAAAIPTSQPFLGPILLPPTVTGFPAPISFVSQPISPSAIPISSVGSLVIPTALASAPFGLASITSAASTPNAGSAGASKTALGASGPTDRPAKEYYSGTMTTAKKNGLIAFGVVCKTVIHLDA